MEAQVEGHVVAAFLDGAAHAFVGCRDLGDVHQRLPLLQHFGVRKPLRHGQEVGLDHVHG